MAKTLKCLVKYSMPLLVLLALPVEAYVGSVSAATGEAGRAAVEASESPFGNPAGLPFLTGYYFSAGFGASRQTTLGTAQDIALSLTDNMRDTVVPTAFSYTQRTTVVEGASENVFQRDLKLSFGNFLRDGLGFGLAVNHEDDRLQSEHFTQTNVQAGFLWSLNKDFGAAAVFENILPGSGAVPEVYRLKSTTAVGGSYNYKRFVRVKVDVITDSGNSLGHPALAAGMENYMNRWLVLRWGVGRNNEANSNLYTAGLGFIGPKFGVNYAFQTSPQNDSLSRHSVDLSVPVW